VPYRPARANVQLDPDALIVVMPNAAGVPGAPVSSGRTGGTHVPAVRIRRHPLNGVQITISDGFVADRSARGSSETIVTRHGARPQPPRELRRFVRMLILERPGERVVVITPPDHGAVAPNVLSIDEAPDDAAIVDELSWEALADWLSSGGRLSACSIGDLARLSCIATPQFAVLIGEVAAQRALEHVWAASGPLRGGGDIDSVLQPLVDAAKQSPRASEALTSALAHAAGAARRRRFG
jgi:hypothetical protein